MDSPAFLVLKAMLDSLDSKGAMACLVLQERRDSLDFLVNPVLPASPFLDNEVTTANQASKERTVFPVCLDRKENLVSPDILVLLDSRATLDSLASLALKEIAVILDLKDPLDILELLDSRVNRDFLDSLDRRVKPASLALRVCPEHLV